MATLSNAEIQKEALKGLMYVPFEFEFPWFVPEI